MNKKDTAIFYSCGICNLNCNYCCIDKNPILKEIDKELGESFQGDYYFNQVKKYFPLPGSLRQIETWGGEPFLKMERMHNLIRQLCGYYFYFNSFYSSTNFSFPQWTDKVLDLLKVFGEFSPRRFTIHLQLSIDGPEYINDRNRGIGTTQKCLNNFNILVSRLPNELPKNINLIITTKGTLDNSSIMALDSKNKVIDNVPGLYLMNEKIELLSKASSLIVEDCLDIIKDINNNMDKLLSLNENVTLNELKEIYQCFYKISDKQESMPPITGAIIGTLLFSNPYMVFGQSNSNIIHSLKNWPNVFLFEYKHSYWMPDLKKYLTLVRYKQNKYYSKEQIINFFAALGSYISEEDYNNTLNSDYIFSQIFINGTLKLYYSSFYNELIQKFLY